MITKPFYIGVFEVTAAQWNLVMSSSVNPETTDARAKGSLSYNDIRGENAGSSWPKSVDVDGASFLGVFRNKTGISFDLPTEAQWEYACRAGTTSDYNNGGDSESDLKMLGRYSGNWQDGFGGYSYITTVGSYAPNAWGLYDMHGNVYEWCLDWYGPNSMLTDSDPKGEASGVYRVLRGGSYMHDANRCDSSFRYDDYPAGGGSGYYSGFRLACFAEL